MKTQYIFSILAAAAMFVGCAKEQNVEEDIPELGENQFFANMEDGAKTILNRASGVDYNKIFWESTDIVDINGSLFTVAPYGPDNRKAIFTLKDGEDVPSGIPYKAYYPKDIVGEGGTLTLPDTYSYDKENPFGGVFPMYAISAGSRNLKFRNICGLLEIKVTGTGKITRLTVTDESKPLSGEFHIDDNNNAVIEGGTAGVTIDCGEGVQLNYTTPTVFYVPAPAASYARLTITTEGDDTWSASTKTIASIERNKVYSLNFDISSALPGLFSISSTEQVRFSPGNLRATYKGDGKYTWGFAEHQYDYIGNDAGNTTIGGSQTKGAVVDLFGWSTSSTYFGINTSTSNSKYSGDFVDWGQNIGDGETWCTLSKDEWEYLIDSRSVHGGTKEGHCYQRATINSDINGGVYGLILYPDNYITQTSATSYTSSEWATMETAGCVFLPAAGYRSGSTMNNVRTFGYYQSSTPGTNAYFLVFHSGEVKTNDRDRSAGRSVRLVKKIESSGI